MFVFLGDPFIYKIGVVDYVGVFSRPLKLIRGAFRYVFVFTSKALCALIRGPTAACIKLTIELQLAGFKSKPAPVGIVVFPTNITF